VFCSTTNADCTANCRLAGPASIDIYVCICEYHLINLYIISRLQVQLDFGYVNDTVVGSPSLESDVTRVVIDFGLPLQGYTDIDDRYGEQISKIEAFLKRADKLLADRDGIEGMDVRYLNDYLVSQYCV
jgi:hypothetical protein